MILIPGQKMNRRPLLHDDGIQTRPHRKITTTIYKKTRPRGHTRGGVLNYSAKTGQGTLSLPSARITAKLRDL